MRLADAIIAVSDQVKEALVREYFLPPEKITVVYNGVEVEKFGIRKTEPGIRGELGVDERDRIILYIGRIEKEKGLDVLLQSLFRIPDSKFRITVLIVGDGPYLLNLKGLAEQLGVADRVIFAGRVPYEEVPRYYQAADLFVLPSLREEGFPMTLPEAMASGLPVVASRIGGIVTAVKDGETGILVKPGDVEGLRTAISKFLADDELRSRMSRNAYQMVKEKFSQESMVAKTLIVLQEMVSASKGLR